MKRWNDRYRNLEHLPQSINPLLEAFVHLLPGEGNILDAACGTGAEAAWLSQRGLNVFAFDFSIAALKMARARYVSLGLPFNAALFDLTSAKFPAKIFDLILNLRYLDRATFEGYRAALKQGGLIIFEVLSLPLGSDPSDYPDFYLHPSEVSQLLSGYEVVHLATLETEHDNEQRQFIQGVARKIG